VGNELVKASSRVPATGKAALLPVLVERAGGQEPVVFPHVISRRVDCLLALCPVHLRIPVVNEALNLKQLLHSN
jgi:hypothetical protein